MLPSFELVVCITSTALFDCSESHEIWKREGVEKYKAHQRDRAGIPLKPGVGFRLVKSLLALNEAAGKHLVEVVLVSRNNSEAGERVRFSINYYKLRITRMSFTCGTDVTFYLPAWKCDLFLSTDEEQVRTVLSGSNIFDGIAAGLVSDMVPESSAIISDSLYMKNDDAIGDSKPISTGPSQWSQDQVRIAFDGDGVLFSDEAEYIWKTQGLEAFFQFEQARGHIALPKGPMQVFALKLQKVRKLLSEKDQWRIRTFLVTARNDVASLRVFHTLKDWGLDIDETYFLGGLDKTPFLRAIDPAIFFDDSSENIDRAKLHIPSAHVIYDIHSIQTSITIEIPIIKLSFDNDNMEQEKQE